MKLARWKFLYLAAGAAAVPAVSHVAKAQTYPTRPITMIVPSAAGGTSDVIGRVLGERMRRSLSQPIIVENVGGADGSIGAARAVRAKPDGYTIVLGFLGSHVLNSALYSLPYDVLNDFAPISPLVTTPFILFASNRVPANSLDDFITWLKANPNKASAGVSAAGPRLVFMYFQKQTDTHFGIVPYRGIPPLMQDLVAGQIDLALVPPDSLPLARAGSIKALAVTSEQRLRRAPDIPTFAEVGLPRIFWSAWYPLFAPKHMPRNIISTLNAATIDPLADPAVQSRLTDLGFEIFPRERQTPEALAAMQKADAEKWWPIIKEFGIKPE